MSLNSQAADHLVLKDGKELTGNLVSIDSKEITFKSAKGIVTFPRSKVVKLTLEKKRAGHDITKAEELPDKWLLSRLKSIDRKQTSDSGIVVIRNKQTFTLTAPGLWTQEQQLTLFITKTPAGAIQHAINFQPETESAEVDHVWYIDENGTVSHLNETDTIRTAIHHKLTSEQVVGYQLSPPKANTVIDIKLVKKHLISSPFKTFQSLIQVDRKSTIEVISPAEKKWQIEHHINNDQKQIKYTYEVRGDQLFQTWKILPTTTGDATLATLAITVKDRFSDEVVDGYSEMISKKLGKIKVTSKELPSLEKLALICHKFASARTAPILPAGLPIQSKQAISHQIELKLAQELITQLRSNGFEAVLLLLRPNNKAAYGKLFNISWYSLPLISCQLEQTYYLHPFSHNYYFPELDTEFQNRTALCVYGKNHGKEIQTPGKNFFQEQGVIKLTIGEILADQSATANAIIDFNGHTGQTMNNISQLPLEAQKKEMTSFLQRYYPGATLLKYTFLDAHPNHSRIELEFNFPGFSTITENNRLLCHFQSLPFTMDSEPLTASYSATVYINVPKGYQLDFLPDNFVSKTPDYQLYLRFMDTDLGYKVTLKKSVKSTLTDTDENYKALKKSEKTLLDIFKEKMIMKTIK